MRRFIIGYGIVWMACASVAGCMVGSDLAEDAGASVDSDADGDGDSDGGDDAGDDAGYDAEGDAGYDAGNQSEADDDTIADQGELEITGTYLSDWGELIDISNKQWLNQADWGTSVYVIIAYYNDADYLVAQYPEDDVTFPGKWSRFEWTYAGSLYYCQSIYGAETMAAADGVLNAADSTDLAAGCGGFSWTLLTPVGEEDAGPEAGDAGADAGNMVD